MKTNLQKQDRLQTFFSVVQLVVFVLLFIALTRILWLLTGKWLLRIFGLIAVYIIVSLFTFFVMRPLCLYLEVFVRKHKKR